MTALSRSVLLASLALWPAALVAQSSIYSVVGLGFPLQPIDARARSLGGGVGALEPRAAVNPAAVAAFQRLTVVVNTEALVRSFEFGGLDESGLQETRFPFALVGGRLRGTPVSFAVSFATYLDRTYDITATDTIAPRGQPVAVSDRQRSRGAVTDLRGAIAWSVSSRAALGVGVHALSGMARVNVRRVFDDPFYANLSYTEDESYSAIGVSLGATVAPTNGLRVGAAVRKDGTLDVRTQNQLIGSYTLPTTASVSVLALMSDRVRWAASGTWRSWSEVGDDLADDRAFDTWGVGTGLEVSNAVDRLPLRVGARYHRLPFSPTDEQPRDITLSLGSGLQFAGNRAIADFTLERALRQGGGVTERAWSLSAALVLVP